MRTQNAMAVKGMRLGYIDNMRSGTMRSFAGLLPRKASRSNCYMEGGGGRMVLSLAYLR